MFSLLLLLKFRVGAVFHNSHNQFSFPTSKYLCPFSVYMNTNSFVFPYKHGFWLQEIGIISHLGQRTLCMRSVKCVDCVA